MAQELPVKDARLLTRISARSQAREKSIADQFEARRAKNKATRDRKQSRREERHAQGAPEAPQAKK